MTEGSPPRRSRWRTIAARLTLIAAVLFVSSIVALVVAEGLVRVVAPQQLIQIRPDLWEPVDTLGWLPRPGRAVTINTGERTVRVASDSNGYRVGKDGPRTADQQILLLGDSFMEALQVEHEQSVSYLLERVLTERVGRAVAVRNAGVAGWNPNHYFLRGRSLLQRDRFALVIVSVFVGNDAVSFRFDRLPPRQPVARSHFRFPTKLTRSEFVEAFAAPMNDALEVRSHLYILAKNQLSTLRMRLGLSADYLPVEYQRTEAGSKRWRITAELSRDLARTATARNVPVLFVLVPERFQVYADDFQRYLRGFGIDSSTVDVDQPSRLLAREFAAERLNVVDALPGMRAAAAASRERLYGSVDQHLSPAGHAALAEIIAPAAIRLLAR
jgi:hypothetical protein